MKQGALLSIARKQLRPTLPESYPLILRRNRNRQARNYIAQMVTDDRALYYHSSAGRLILGIMRVKAPAFPDPTSNNPEWLSVEFEPEITFEHPVTFEQLKSTDALRELKLFKQPRLSVMPLTEAEYLAIQELSVLDGLTDDEITVVEERV